ncbi:DNA recombination protein RmuC [Luteimonas viscosa]|uniref:DNA recombination protein RmuC n=1 Tax=Luteimonas viscosa TaxID=1132694 RepID=A0A5D4XPE7_9GAMM|nr:DNA recombination protein RmuC [Luteimonas viscosa]TYT26459.1 DNA recombination protein RmuC [Luteimonas viscosa]
MDQETLLWLLCGMGLVALALLVVLLLRRPEARLEQALREEQRDGRAELRQQLDSLSASQEQRIDAFGRRLDDLATRTDQRLDVLREALTDDARKARSETAELHQRFESALGQRLAELTQRNEQRIGEMRATLEQQLQRLQADNAEKLEQMRATVDEKLQSTLETRLGQSFRLVSERLEQVQRGLGEMQQLATGVGDLKRVLTNVKTRGIFGEVQLGALLEQVLTIEQYACNVATVPGSSERVEFAVRLPGSHDTPILLPIDAKFPREDYERLLDAQDRVDVDAVNVASIGLERQVKLEARRIRDKYLAPPHTTDFALLFLPTEGLYAEVLRRPGLFEVLQREFRVTLVGPTTLLALLNSLQMGFRTLAIEKRSSEVWQLLGTVKSEFGKFATVLEKANSQLDTVQNSIKQAGVRTRAIERQLKGVESLPGTEDAPPLLDADD